MMASVVPGTTAAIVPVRTVIAITAPSAGISALIQPIRGSALR